jgi:type I restriction enzyme S subunit
MTLVEARPKAAGGDAASADGPWELPEGWVWAPLKLLCSFIGRGRGPTYVSTGGVPVLNQKCVRWHRLERQHLKLTAREAYERLPPELHLKIGDILWNSTGTGTIGRALVYDGSFPELTVDSHVTIVRPNSVEAKFLGYLIETTHVQHLVVDGHVGSTNQQELPRSFVEGLPIPLAPLAEQRRIVARIDELFAEIAEGEAALREARKGLDLFRRALLKAAVTGELTKDWRAENRHTETGHDLLNRIRVQRKAKAPAKSRSRGASRLASLDTSNLSELPEGWIWTSWSDVGSSQNGRPFPSSAYTDSGVRLLRPGNLFADGSVRWTNKNTKHLPEKFAEENDDLIVREGELVINLTAQSLKDDFLGRVCITSTGELCLLNQRLARLTPFLIDSRYMLQVFKSTLFRGFVNGLNSGSLIQHMFTSQIERFVFPLPPPAEIDEILRRVSDALSAVNDTADLLDAEAADAARLRQSVLKAAFEGRLVPQDPADEPASSLLRSLVEPPSDPIIRKRGRPRKVS